MRRFYALSAALLTGFAAHAQQPALPAAPTPPPATSPVPITPAQPIPPDEIIGQTYSVELRSGTTFLGKLVAASPTELSFETKDLGVITVQRVNLRQLTLRSQDQARRGFEDVGNSTRMFFAPTARNLRKGEGYVQSLDIVLAGVNYGITDNFSVGLLIPIIPNVGVSLIAVTPKVSVPVADKFSVGAGLLYAFYGGGSGGSGGVAYGVATYGTNDSNLTLGAGYGVGSGGFSSTPVVVVGGNVRVSNRVFLVDENYIYDGGIAGLAGLRVAATRISGSLGILYASGLNTVVPAYVEVAYRFGRVKP